MHGIIPSYCGVDPSSQLEGSSAPVPPEFSTQLHRLSALHFLSQITCEDWRRPEGEFHSITYLRYEVAPILHQASETASLIIELSPFYDFTNPCLLWPLGLKLKSTARLILSCGVTNALSLARATPHLKGAPFPRCHQQRRCRLLVLPTIDPGLMLGLERMSIDHPLLLENFAKPLADPTTKSQKHLPMLRLLR